MNNDQDFDQTFDSALNALRHETAKPSLDRFEAQVWSEIAIRDGRRTRVWLQELLSGGSCLPAPVAVSVTVAGITLGSLLGLSRAEAYDREASLALEERYVQSIHPVMMIENHDESPSR